MKRHFTSFSRSSQLHLVPSGSGADLQSNPMFDIRVYIYIYIHTHPFCYMYKKVPNINHTNDPNLGEYSRNMELMGRSYMFWIHLEKPTSRPQIDYGENWGNYCKTATIFSSGGEICSKSARHATRCKMLTFLACLHVYGELVVVLCSVFVNVQQVFEDSEAPIDPSTSFLVWN